MVLCTCRIVSPPHLPLGPRLGLGRSAEVFLYGPAHVLKLYKLQCDPVAPEQEFAAAQCAYSLGLPVPAPIAIVKRKNRIGIVFERVHGRDMHRAYICNPMQYLLGLKRLALLQRDVHMHAVVGLPDLHDRLRIQIEQARISELVKRTALATLDRLPRGSQLSHGDLHPDNVMTSTAGLSIVDWQKAGIGSPAADVARTALLLRYGSVDLGRIEGVLPLDMIRTKLADLYIGWYCRASGTEPSEVKAWMLPLLVSRLFGKPADDEAEVRAAVETLAQQIASEREWQSRSIVSNIDSPDKGNGLVRQSGKSVSVHEPTPRDRLDFPGMINQEISRKDRQTTFVIPVERAGRGLHTGQYARVRLSPAPADHGIIFRRRLAGGKSIDVPALWRFREDQPLCTALRSPEGPLVRTVEHLLAALNALEIDNALVEIDSEELPIFDGSALPWCDAIQEAGKTELGETRRVLRVLRRVNVERQDRYICIEPSDALNVAARIDLAYFGQLNWSDYVTPKIFEAEIAPSRSFGRYRRALIGRAWGFLSRRPFLQGCSSRSAALLWRGRVIGGMRFPDEPVRHRVLDVIGDLALLGHPVRGRVTALRTGHELNHALVAKLMADPTAWELV